MASPKISPSLETDREKTDESLLAERAKTNVSLTEVKEKVEERTDEIVKKERNKTDRKTTLSRIEADTQCYNERETAETPAVKDERKTSDDCLVDERRHADKIVEKERFGVDAAIEKEREIKNALIDQVLEQERQQTDQNLSTERTQTDSDIHRASDLLSDEITKHSKTKESLVTRDEFLAIVSHDLKNPLSTVFTCAELLLEESISLKMDSEIKNSIELIKRNADTALRLIADLLDTERIAQGKLLLKLELHSLRAIIRESLENFALTASAKRIHLSVVDWDIPYKVICDRERLLQVISNLIGNALKFTPPGGSVILDANFGEKEVQVSVSDTGQGISAEKQKLIFSRFAHFGLKDRTGLGLGLYISNKLIEAHQGRLWVQSKVGEGSTFFFTIPRHIPAPNA